MTRPVALGGVVGISFSAIFVALADVSPSTSAFLRFAFALPALLLVAWRRGALRGLDRSGARYALLAGGVFALNITVWHSNIDVIGTGLSTVMGNAQVLFIGVLAWLLYGERPTRLALALIPVMLFGVVLLSGLIGVGATTGRPLLGAVLGVATALLNATWFLLFREATRRTRRTAGALALLTGAAAVVSLAASFTDPGFSLGLPAASYGWLLVLAVVSQVFGWLFISPALGHLPALEVTILLLLQPSLTLVWDALIFDESHGPLQWTGVAILLGCIALLNRHGSTRPAPAPDVAPLPDERRPALVGRE